MATNIEQIFRSFVVNKFREIQEEQQQQHGGGKVEGQPNGDTIPAEQANPSDDTGAGAGSRQNDQIVQKIEEVLSGALDTEPQSKSDVDKNTVNNSTKSTKRSSTAEDEIPKKKSKKNKKHKSKKKKKKKKKRKKEKKHKKQPKESKLSARHGEHAGLQPVPQLMPEKSSSKLSVQHGGFGDANLAVHVQPAELSLKANEELDRQALGLTSHLSADSQPSTENLGSEKGTLCATDPRLNLEASQFNIQQNASMTQICTREEQIKQSHESICPIAVNVIGKGDFFVTGSDASTSIPSGVANKSVLPSEAAEAVRGSESALRLQGAGEVTPLHTSLACNTAEMLRYSEASLQSVALGAVKELETTSKSVYLTGDVTTISKSADQADLNTVKVTHMSVSPVEGSSILKAALEPIPVMEDVKNKQVDSDAALQHSSKIPAETALTQVEMERAKISLAPGTVTKVKDIEPATVSVHMENVRPLEEVQEPVMKPKTSETVMDVKETSDPVTALNASEVLLQPKFFTEMRSLTDENVIAEVKSLQATSEHVVQAFVPQTVPETQTVEGFKSPQATVEVVAMTGIRDLEMNRGALQLENTNASKISESESNARGLEATPQSLQKGMKAPEEPFSCRTVGGVEPVTEPGALAEMMHETHVETVAVPLFTSQIESCVVSQSEIMTDTSRFEATSQNEAVAEKRDFELTTHSTIAEVRVLGSLSEAEAVAEVKGVEGSSKTCLTEMKNLEMTVGSETRTLMQDWGKTLVSEVGDLKKARSEETVLEPVQTMTVITPETNSKYVHMEELGATVVYGTGSKPNEIETESEVVKAVEYSKTTPEPLQECTVGISEAVLESFPRAEETVMEVRNLEETLESKISTHVRTQGPAVEYIVATKEADTEKAELSSMIDVRDLEEGTERGMKAKYLGPSSEAGEVRLLDKSMKESAAAEKGSETVKEPEVHMDIQHLETSQKYGKMAEMNVLEDASETFAVTKQHIEPVPSTEEAPEIWSATEMKSSEIASKPGDAKGLEAMLEREVQYSEGEQCQQMEDVRVPDQAPEREILLEKKDAEQTLPLEPLIASSGKEIATESGVASETIFSSSHAADGRDSVVTSGSQIIRDTEPLEAAPTCVAETKDVEAIPVSETVVELKDVEAAVELEADTQDLEVAPIPETVTEEAGQSEAIPQEADKEVAAEEASETRDSETSDVQPDVAARMRETLMRLEKVVEKSSHRSSEKSKHDAKKQKRSRSKSQSRSRKRKKKSRSRSTSRRLASKRARSRSRNYSDSRKKHSKSRSRSVEKRERRVSSRRSRRRRSRSSDRYRSKSRSVEKTRRSGRGRSRSSDRYRSKSRSVEKRGSRLSSRRSRRRRSRSSDRYRSKSRSAEKRGSRLSSRRSRRRRSRSSDRYRSKSRSVEKTRRSGRRRSRSSDRYRSKSRSVEKTRRSGRRRSRSSDRYRSKSRSVEKTRRSGRRRSRSSDRYRSKSLSVEKRGSRLSSWRSRRRRSRSSDRSKSRSRSSEKRGGKEYSWRFRNRSVSSDRSKSRSRSVEKRGRKSSLRRSKRRRSKSSDRYKSRSRSVEKRDRKQSSRKSKRQRSKSSDRYKSRSKSVEKKKESSRKSKRRRSKSSERYKSRSRSVEKKRKESSKKSKRKRSKSSDSVKSTSKSVEKRESKLSSVKSISKHVDSSEQEKVAGPEPLTSEGSSSKSSNGPMSAALSLEGVNGPELPPTSESGLSKTFDSIETSSSSEKMSGLQPSVVSDSYQTPGDQEQRSMLGEEAQVSVTSENGVTALYDSDLGSVPAEKAVPLESSSLPELTFSTSDSVSSSVEKRDLETTSVTEFQLSASHQVESRSTSLREVEGPEPLLTLAGECSASSDGYKSISVSSGNVEVQGSSVMSESVLSDGYELRHIPVENAEPQKFLQVSQSEYSELADSSESRPLSSETTEVQKPFLVPEVTRSEFSNVHESASLPIAKSQMEEPSLASDAACFKTPDRHELGSSFCTQTEELPLLSPDGKVKAPGASVTSECDPVGITVDLISSSAETQEVLLTTVVQSCKSSEAHESSSSVEKDAEGSATSQVLGVDCFESSEMRESRYLPAGKTEVTESILSKSGIPVSHDGRESKYNYLEKTEGAEQSLASELRCSVFPEGHELIPTAAGRLETQKTFFPLKSGLSESADESLSTPNENLEATVPSVTSQGGLFVLPDNHELRATQTENAEVQEPFLSSEEKSIESRDEHHLRSASGKEMQVSEEQPVIVESRCSVSSDYHELTSTPLKKVEIEDPLQMSGNEYTVGIRGPELMSTRAEKAEVQELYLTPKDRCSVSVESQELLPPSFEKTEVQEPALTSENEYTVSWECQELRSSSPEKVEMQEPSVLPDNEYAVYSEDQELQSSPAGKTEVQDHSLTSENEYGASPEGQEMTVIPAVTEVQEPSLASGSDYPIFHEGQGIQSMLAEKTVVQEPSLISGSEYVVSPERQELSSTLPEKTEVQECSVLSENEYDASPEGRDLRSSPVEKEEMGEASEASESESSMSTDSQELQSTAVGKTEVQELSLLSEGECSMSPEVQELQSSPAEKAEGKEPSLTYENEHAASPEGYESRLTRGDKTEDVDSSLTSENYHVLSFESQEVRFTAVQKVDVQELSPRPESEHTASPDGQGLRFLAAGQVGGPEPLALNDRASMSPDVSDLKSIPVEQVDDAMPSIPESACSMSPGGHSVKSVPGEETGDLEPSLTAECRHSTSPYHDSQELKSPMEEEGVESSLTLEHRRSVSPEGLDQKSVIDEEMEDREPSLTSEHRRSTSPDEHESRSSIGEEAEYSEQPLATERRSSVSSDEHDSRSTAGEEAEDVEPSLTGKRRDSTSSDERESRSTTGEEAEDQETSLTAERRDSVSSDDRESRSTTGEEAEDLEPLTAEHRRSMSPDGRESRSTTGEEAEDQEPSLTAERRHSTSSDEHESRSTAGEDVEDVEPSLTAERRDSTSSDEHDSRSTAGEEDLEPSLTTEHRRSTSPDGRESRSTTGEEAEDVEPSLTAERRDSTSSDEHESTTGEEVEDTEPSLAVEDKHDESPSMPLEKSEGQDSSFLSESRRSESSEREKSRSESVEKLSDRESSQRSRSRRSKSPAHETSRSPSVEKAADKESLRRSRRRHSRSTSVEKAADKESSRRSRRRRSRSTSVEKAADKESSRRSRRRRSRSTSVEKAADKESSRRSRSRRSRSSQRRSQRYDTESRSRRNRSRSVTRRRASRSKSNRRSRSSSLSRSRHRRRSRSRSASRRRRSLSRDRRKRSQRNRSRSTDRRRRRSDSRDRRISLRLRSRSRTPIRQRRSRSRGRRRSSSRSPIRLRRSRSSGRRRGYSRSPDRRRSRSSERFSSRSPKRLTDLDKAQLLEIAKANAAAMCAKSGVPLPPSLMPMLSKKDDKASQKSSRDTLKELTEKCKKIAQSTDDVIVNKPHVSDEEEEERPFYNHPFKLNEPKPIFFNLSTPSIKPAPPPQPKNQVSLSKEFPVSSGSQHRKKEADSVYGEWVPVEKGKDDGKDDVFPKPSIEGVDITTAMNDRAIAQKRLNENTFDLEAMCMLNRAQEQIDAWAQSNSIPGQFTGSTGAQILSSDELTNSGPQAWIRKDQFLRAAPVTGGMGAQLMRKMGWREGEGLGKNKEGSVEPIMVDFKTDRKGLVAVGEKAQKRSGHYVVMKDLSGKHPVSALMEICNKRRWSPPEFVLVDDSGPDHRKHFIFKVRVNGNEYRPTFASLNKKHAKATAATAALQAMGLVPKESMVNTTMFRSASHR